MFFNLQNRKHKNTWILSKQAQLRQIIQDIKGRLQRKQSMAYELIMLSPQEYILHQFTKITDKGGQSEAINGIDLLNQKFLLNHQLSKDKNSKIVVKKSASGYSMRDNVSSYKSQLKQKLCQINSSLSLLSKKVNRLDLAKSQSIRSRKGTSQKASGRLSFLSNKKTEEQINNIIEFRRPGYWIKNQEKTKKIKEFLQHHQKQREERHKKYQQQIQKSMQRIQHKKQQQEQARECQKLQTLKRRQEKTLQYRERRENSSQKHQNQVQKIEQFLQKINSQSQTQNKRLYTVLQQKYQQQLTRQRQNYKQKLLRIKQSHSPFDQEQLDQHIRRHQEYKQSLEEESRRKRESFQGQRQEAYQQLANLFQGKRYREAVQQQSTSPYKRSMSQLIQRKTKRKEFAQNVIENFKPTVSSKKRKSLQESVRELNLSEDKSKRKVFKNGQIMYQQKTQTDGRRKGIQYLAFLRKHLQNKPKKQHSPLGKGLVQSDKVKRIDYLRQKKPNITSKASVAQWKKVIHDDSFEPKDKYAFVKQSITTLEHKAFQKQIETRNLKKSALLLQKKDELDSFYMQSIEAKMAILDNLMLKGPKR